MKVLPPADAGAVRRAHLRSYVLACLRDKLLSWSDLKSPTALVAKLLQVVKDDGREVFEDLGRDGGANGLRLAAGLVAQKFMDLADEIQGAGKRKR